VQFYRQKPIGNHIVDFYSPKVKLVIEVDGSQHLEPNHVQKDLARKNYLQTQGLLVLRFDNLQVLQKTDEELSVVDMNLRDWIWNAFFSLHRVQ